MVAEKSLSRAHSTKTGEVKVPQRINKAEREKMKRERVNKLFSVLAKHLEMAQENNGKASILGEATCLLTDMFSHIEVLRRENAALLSESRYMTVEKDELQNEKDALEAQIKKLHSQLEERVVQSKLDLNVAPTFQQPEVASHLSMEYGLLQPPEVSPVFVIPFHSGPKAYPETDSAHPPSQSTTNISKPHARYPTRADSWASQLLGNQLEPGKDSQQNGKVISRFAGGD